MRTLAILALLLGLGSAHADALIARETPVRRIPLPGGGVRVEVPLVSADALAAVGLHEWSGGSSRFTSEGLEIHAKGFEEWLGYDQSDWIRHVNSARWAVEARFRVDRGCDRLGTGFWIYDGRSLTRVYVSRDAIGVADTRVRVPIGSTDRMRLYRVEVAHEELTLSVDGTAVYRGPVNRDAQGTASLSIGSGGTGCGDEASTWASLAYELYPRTTEAVLAQ